MKYCFEPWIDNDTEILVVGTMPSEISIAHNMYYANSQNRFWKYMQQILNEKLLDITKEERKRILLSYHIGLWDALASCERRGSLDSNIKEEIPNNFNLYPQIKYYIFNGQKSFYFFKKYNRALLTESNHIIAPSTSPANASVKEDTKYNSWQMAIMKNLVVK